MRPAMLAYLCWAAAAGLWLAATLSHGAGLRINHTPSLPIGLWRVTPIQAPLGRGMIVSVCPPATAILRTARARGYLGPGRCPGGFEPLLKPVIALAGDRVALGADGVAVNGEPVPGSARLGADGAGRSIPAIPFGVYEVPPGEFWALSPAHPGSFDSRYFGAVAIENIEGVASPLLSPDSRGAGCAAHPGVLPSVRTRSRSWRAFEGGAANPPAPLPLMQLTAEFWSRL